MKEKVRDKQAVVMLNQEEWNLLEKLRQEIKGTKSQVMRLALCKYAGMGGVENAK